MSAEPGAWTPVAGGTEVMVQFGAGKLAAHRLVSIRDLSELCGITATADELHIGAGSTYSDLRKNDIVSAEFPLLSSAASWTGSIANQNRGTLAGNIVNASPAADSLPALLSYDAELILISARGERRIPYADFHTGYKKTLLAPDELIRTIVLPRRYTGWISCARKIGPRNAQAIAKLCMAALVRLKGGLIQDVRISFGSMAPTPLRLYGVEGVLRDHPLTDEAIHEARRALEAEVSPIDDIRSTRAYRVAVACNLLEEFLHGLKSDNQSLARWNMLPSDEAAAEILSCCGSTTWAHEMAAARPFQSLDTLFTYASELWRSLDEAAWMEAFRSHPRIGERHAERSTTAASATWSSGEQRNVSESDSDVKQAIAEGNRHYEDRFGRIFIICATDKKPSQILTALEQRHANDATTELHESAKQQEKIMQLRLRKWLQPEVKS
jgi:OHCU decarboxylase